MPSRRSSSDSVKPRRGGRTRNETPPPRPLKKVNGSHKETKDKKKDKDEESEDRIDLSSETSCRLCDKKDFKPNTEALAKHYATAHFKSSLETEIRSDNSCNICKAKKLKSMFGSRKELVLHLATVHSRAEHLLSDQLGIPVDSSKLTRSGFGLNRAYKTMCAFLALVGIYNSIV